MAEGAWDGRCWVTSSIRRLVPKRSFRFLSYNVLADYKCNFIYYSTAGNWDFRRETLLSEILSYRPDLFCLQDVDHYNDWWLPQLTQRGYDTVFTLRTQEKDFHYEGVMIAYRRDMFQVYKTIYLQFNDAVQTDDRGSYFREMSKTDDVGIIALFQPLGEYSVQSAVCVVSAMLSDVLSHSEVRLVQTEYLTRQIELANQEFHLPVLIGISLNDTPDSLAYTLMSTGRIPLAGQVPKRCPKLYGVPTCRGSVLLKWLPPKMTLADPPLLCFRIAYRPGGSNIMGYKTQIEVGIGDCVRYAERVDENRNVKMVALDEREYTISGLCSDVPYEFKISAVNEVGEGVWSEPCKPVILNNPSNAPEMPELRQLLNLEKLSIQREEVGMRKDDWNVQNARRTDAVAAETQLTPRFEDGSIDHHIPRGRVLPFEANPRTGWKERLHGQPNPVVIKEMHQEIVVLKSVLRDKQGYVRRYLNNYNEDIARLFEEEEERELAALQDVNGKDKNEKVENILMDGNDLENPTLMEDQSITAPVMNDESNDRSDEDDEDDDFFPVEQMPNSNLDQNNLIFQSENSIDDTLSALDKAVDTVDGEEPIEMDNYESRVNRFREEYAKVLEKMMRKRLRVLQEEEMREQDVGGVLVDAREVMDSIGLQNKRQIHNLQLRSVYAGYSAGGEPLYTVSAPKERNRLGTSCVDYIFYSSETLSTRSYLSIPPLSRLREGTSPQEHCCVLQAHHSQPFQIGKMAFDQPLKQLFAQLNIARDGDLLSSTEDPSNVKYVSRSKIEEAKRILRRGLTASRTAGNADNPKRGGLWGGKWAPFPTLNHQRSNFFLPNDVFASSHIALAAEFELNEQMLAVQWS